MFSLHKMKIFMAFTEKEYFFFFFFIVYMSMRTSDIITNVTKQNMNVMVSIFSDFTCEALERQNQKFSAN